MIQCGTCTHFKKVPGQVAATACFLKPPTVAPMQDTMGNFSIMGVYPPVKSDTPSCGEYKSVPVSGLP